MVSPWGDQTGIRFRHKVNAVDAGLGASAGALVGLIGGSLLAGGLGTVLGDRGRDFGVRLTGTVGGALAGLMLAAAAFPDRVGVYTVAEGGAYQGSMESEAGVPLRVAGVVLGAVVGALAAKGLLGTGRPAAKCPGPSSPAAA
jgi:hypothetical protein